MFPTQMTAQMAQERGRDDRERAANARRRTMRWRHARTSRIGQPRR
jgi:hypothetical protein